MTKCTEIEAMLKPAIEELGYILWGCEYIGQGKHSVLRVYLDSNEGILVEDCQKASHQIGAILDVEDPISSHYTLEVSSPGLERPLFNVSQYLQFVGQEAKVKLSKPLYKKRVFSGLIEACSDTDLTLSIDNESLPLPLSSIVKANLVFVER